MLSTRTILTTTHVFNAVSAIGGGIALATGAIPVPMSLLQNTPFETYLVPGIFLAVVIGGSSLVGAVALGTHARAALPLSAAAGVIMIGWITGETILIEGFSWLQGLYLATGLLVVALSMSLWRSRTAQPSRTRAL